MTNKPIAPFRGHPKAPARRPGRLWPPTLMAWLVLIMPGWTAPNEGGVLGVDEAHRVGKHEPIGEGVGLPYSQILRDTEPPYENLFRDVRLGGRVTEKIGPADATARSSLFSGPRINVPLAARGIRPEDAEFKLGRFYLDVRALSGSLLFSDNVDLSEDDRDKGVIGIVRLTAAALYQVTDNVRLAVQATGVYLPFTGEVGIAGFGVDDPMVEFETIPLFQTQLTLDQQVGGWDVEVFDDLRIRHRRFGAGASLDAFEGETFDEEDRAGRYRFRDNTRSGSGSNDDDRSDRIGYDFIEGRNLVGASAGRLLPTVTRLEFGGYHANYWYTGDRDSDLPSSRDTVYAALISQRETTRFKPFVRYQANHYDTEPGWGQEMRGGVQGPVTENLNALADVGYYWRTDSSHSTYLAGLRLRHSFNPLTYHQLYVRRGVTAPVEEIEDSVTYLIRHVFREDLSGQFYGSLARFEDARTGGETGEERRAALRFTYDLAQHTSLRLSGTYLDYRDDEEDDEEDDNFQEWIARAEIFFRHTASLQTRIIYQYRERNSESPGDSFYENLLTLTLIKYF